MMIDTDAMTFKTELYLCLSMKRQLIKLVLHLWNKELT